MTDIFSREYEIDYGHIDNRGIAKPSFLWTIMQDAATVHAEARHLGPSELGIVWVLSRIRAVLARPLLPYERITCRTWCPGVRGASWYRCFSFLAGDEPVGEAQSMWVTLDPRSRRIVRPSAFPAAKPYLEGTGDRLFDALPKLCGENVQPHHIHPVLYSDLDVNNHVNNVRIVELISDALDLQAKNSFVSSLQVNYTSETVFGEQLTLLCGNAGEDYYICGEAGGKTHFEAQASLSPTERQVP